MPASTNASTATAQQRAAIDRLSAALRLPSEADSVASASEAEAAIAELTRLHRRLCWRG